MHRATHPLPRGDLLPRKRSSEIRYTRMQPSLAAVIAGHRDGPPRGYVVRKRCLRSIVEEHTPAYLQAFDFEEACS